MNDPGDFRVPFSIGMLITVIGAYWDAWRHISGLAASESLWNPFLNPAHGTIYGGATIMAVSIFLLLRKTLILPSSFGIRTKFALAIGAATLLGGGGYDFWWHNAYGFADVTPWTPSHMTATAGFLILLVTGLVSLSKDGPRIVKAFFALSLTLFIGLWVMVILAP